VNENDPIDWRKASDSMANGNCVEVATITERTAA
jgi:hypothetical protein